MTSNSHYLIKNANIIDGTGEGSFSGAVAIEGGAISQVLADGSVSEDGFDKVIDAEGKTLLPGLCDAHLHLTWNDQPTLEYITMMPPEEHLIHSINVSKKVLLSGITSGVGAAAARPRMDCVLRNAIENGDIVGPRYLANTQEITTKGGLGDTSPVHVDLPELSFGWVVSGPEEMRKSIRQFVKYGVDNIKLNLSGEEITGLPAKTTTMAEDEVAAAMAEIKPYGMRACAHARSAESVKQCIRHGIEIIYHASYADEECLDLLEENKDKFFVAPGLAWLIQTAYGAEEYGIAPGSPLAQLYAQELEVAVETMAKMHKRGIRVLPGGDYGFAWTPHGTNAKDLQYLVDYVGMSPMDAIVSATKYGGQIMGQPEKIGLIKPGYYADILLIDGNPLEDISVIHKTEMLKMVMKDGVIYRCEI